MYSINRHTSKEFRNAYVYQTINSCGQTLKMEIYESIDSPEDNSHFLITFFISNKRKTGFQVLKSTGKDGIKSLLWAKECIIDFIKHIETKDWIHGYITVHWDDSRRKRIYCYGLKKMGFYMGRVNGKECLLYKLRTSVK